MAKLNEEFASEVIRVLSARGWSLRQAEIQTGIHYSVIHNLKEGRVPSAETVVKWAEAIREAPADWLRVAGYEKLAELIEQPPSEHRETREPFLDDLPPELQRVEELHGRTIDAVKHLPPGPEYDRYVAALRANAETMNALIAERLDGKEER